MSVSGFELAPGGDTEVQSGALDRSANCPPAIIYNYPLIKEEAAIHVLYKLRKVSTYSFSTCMYF